MNVQPTMIQMKRIVPVSPTPVWNFAPKVVQTINTSYSPPTESTHLPQALPSFKEFLDIVRT
jgi:hypothetical protein